VRAAAAPAAALEAFLARERAAVDAALARAVADGLPLGAPAPRLEPVLRYAAAGGGKRLRPVLLVAAYRAAGGASAPAVYSLGAAVELVHTYSLVHDDLPCMDDDARRRGRPTTHVVYGSPAALLAGAALIPLALRTLTTAAGELELPPERRTALALELCQGAGAAGMVGGQLLDLDAEGGGGQAALSESRLAEIHRRKTGALLAAAIRMGALAAGADPAVVAALGAYGQGIGLAFQIADDLLDRVGGAELGKTPGKDAAAAKATFPGVLGEAGARRRAGQEVERAVAALAAGGIDAPELVALARYTIERDR
jgi:geranylgeranyl pyrophosphate synthase